MKALLCLRDEFALRLYNDDRLVKTYVCAVGRSGYETPEGAYEIQNRIKDPDWWLPDEPWVSKDLRGEVLPPGPFNPLKSRWMGLVDGVGIHGTDQETTLGTAVSHGCIRLSISDVEDLFERVAVGVPVLIV